MYRGANINSGLGHYNTGLGVSPPVSSNECKTTILLGTCVKGTRFTDIDSSSGTTEFHRFRNVPILAT